MSPDTISLIAGSIGGVLLVGSMLPQIFMIQRTKSAHDISWGTLVLLVAMAVAFQAQAIALWVETLMISNGLFLVQLLVLMILKRRYG